MSRPSPAQSRAESLAAATQALQSVALLRALDEPIADGLALLLTGRLARRPDTVDLAADAAVRDAANALLTHGWKPAELHTFAARRLDAAALTYLVDALAATGQWSSTVEWFAELSRLGARVWWSVGEPHLGQWARRHGRARVDTIRVAVDVLALVSHLPRTDQPLAHAAAAPDVAAGTLIQDRRIVGRIDALLARAGSSGFPDEALACAAKAQELMVRYATVPAAAGTAPSDAAAALQRLCAESPLAAAKTVLAGARTGASLGRGALSDPRRFIGVFGEEVAGLIQKAARVLAPGGTAPNRGTPVATRRPLPLAVRA